MSVRPIDIKFDGASKPFTPGAAYGPALLTLGEITGAAQLLLDVAGDVDIPIAASDLILIRGGESFVTGDGNPPVEDNPRVRRPVHFLIDGSPEPKEHLFDRAKVFGSQLKDLAGAAGGDLWADLDGLADVLIADDQRIVLQPNDSFIVVPASAQDEDRFYEVTVIADGKPKKRLFPARMTVAEATKRSLSPRDRPEVDKFQMVDRRLGTAPLGASLTLKDAGVRDGDELSITKQDGGGGAE